jgi:hypothetical protein
MCNRAAVHLCEIGRARESVEHVGQRADKTSATLADFARGRHAVPGAREGVRRSDAEAVDCAHHCVATRAGTHARLGRRPASASTKSAAFLLTSICSVALRAVRINPCAVCACCGGLDVYYMAACVLRLVRALLHAYCCMSHIACWLHAKLILQVVCCTICSRQGRKGAERRREERRSGEGSGAERRAGRGGRADRAGRAGRAGSGAEREAAEGAEEGSAVRCILSDLMFYDVRTSDGCRQHPRPTPTVAPPRSKGSAHAETMLALASGSVPFAAAASPLHTPARSARLRCTGGTERTRQSHCSGVREHRDIGAAGGQSRHSTYAAHRCDRWYWQGHVLRTLICAR